MWKKRQQELKEAAAAMVTDLSLMQELLGRIMPAVQPRPDPTVPVPSAQDLLEALQDLEYHVTDLDNARDFATVRKLLCSASLQLHRD